MAGTKAGGIKARETNYKEHGADFYKRIGKIGGQNGHTGGFASSHELAVTAGAIGGRKSKRGSAKHNVLDQHAERIVELVDAGVSYVDIAKLYDVPYHTMTYWLRKERSK